MAYGEHEESATKEISYTSWRNKLKSSWNHEKSKQISLKSSSEISPILQPHPLLQHMTSLLREIKRKSGNLARQIARCRPLGRTQRKGINSQGANSFKRWQNPRKLLLGKLLSYVSWVCMRVLHADNENEQFVRLSRRWCGWFFKLM